MYRNHRGEIARRTILPLSIEFTSTLWHPNPQWLLHARDLDKGVDRSFALADIIEWEG